MRRRGIAFLEVYMIKEDTGDVRVLTNALLRDTGGQICIEVFKNMSKSAKSARRLTS